MVQSNNQWSDLAELFQADFEDQLLDCDQAEQFLLISKPTLARLRVNGTGPPYVQISANRVGYLKSDLLAYVKSRRRRSTLD